MDNALGMDHDRNTLHFNIEKPASFDHLQALVEKRRRINGDLPAHYPGRMFQSALDRDARELLPGCGAERTARGGQPELANGACRFAVQTLKNRGVLAIHRE